MDIAAAMERLDACKADPCSSPSGVSSAAVLADFDHLAAGWRELGQPSLSAAGWEPDAFSTAALLHMGRYLLATLAAQLRRAAQQGTPSPAWPSGCFRQRYSCRLESTQVRAAAARRAAAASRRRPLADDPIAPCAGIRPAMALRRVDGRRHHACAEIWSQADSGTAAAVAAAAAAAAAQAPSCSAATYCPPLGSPSHSQARQQQVQQQAQQRGSPGHAHCTAASQPFAGERPLPMPLDASWLDGLPLPDLFDEADPLLLFPGSGTACRAGASEPDALLPALPPLPPAVVLPPPAASQPGSPALGAQHAQQLLGGLAVLAPPALPSEGAAGGLPWLCSGGGGSGSDTAAADVLGPGAGSWELAQLALMQHAVKQEQAAGHASARAAAAPDCSWAPSQGSVPVGLAVRQASSSLGQGGSGDSSGAASAAAAAAAAEEGAAPEGKTRRKRGRPRLYDTTPAAIPAAADTSGGTQQDQEQQPVKRGRGPKPKYVFGSREEAAGARRERNRKAALDSYYRQRAHVKELEAERDRLLAENASLEGLLGHLQAGGPCPLQELNDDGIDAWLSTV